MALDDPGLVVGLPEPLECQAQLFDGVEAADPQEVLLQHPDEALGAAVALGLADEGRRAFQAKEADLALEMVADILRPMIVTEREAMRPSWPSWKLCWRRGRNAWVRWLLCLRPPPPYSCTRP